MNEIESIKTIVLVLTFIVAGIQDWKYREISPKIWLPSMAIGILSNAYLFISMNLNDALYLISITITSIMLMIFAILSFWLKLFGGADFLALLTFSLNYPFSTMLNSLYLYIRPDVNLPYLLIAILPPIVIILLFYCFLVFLIIIYNIINNLINIRLLGYLKVPLYKKILYTIFYRVTYLENALRKKFYFPIYIPGYVDRITFNIDEEFDKWKEKVVDLQPNTVVVISWGLPMVTFLSISILIYIVTSLLIHSSI
ncbi:peptidase A24A prepilin type IV [Ignisphaera aggregans DSM 17230]|uniref:Peptidase A24A prepilin type IV n=1 Tax=Ignisphaera aggregans (strain DSM 17230 / JCM 13409 / AQ1.S1) TaxID=583356 RepID=E0SQK7_IGNAA|nr:peptidase A24A prepilin type IV [Ignisphaera aggregans DSM 17230]